MLKESEKMMRGNQIAHVLMLRRDRDCQGRYLTEWGNKTALGIYETVKRLIEKGE